MCVAMSLCVFVYAVYIAAAIKNYLAMSIYIGIFSLFSIYIATDHKWALYQSIGIFRPLLVLGLVSCYETILLSHWRRSYIMITTVASMLLLCVVDVPRFIGAVQRYTTEVPKNLVISKAEIKDARRVIGTETTEIDTTNPVVALVALIEFATPGSKVQWSERGFGTITSYRHWERPNYSEAPTLFIVSNAEVGPTDKAMYKCDAFTIVTR